MLKIFRARGKVEDYVDIAKKLPGSIDISLNARIQSDISGWRPSESQLKTGGLIKIEQKKAHIHGYKQKNAR